jgi:GTPase SAR1 family protein
LLLPSPPGADCSGDVGGQKTLRTYWKNYFEKTDTLIWVVDATDRERIDDCRLELEGLLQEEVRRYKPPLELPLTVDSG